MTATEELAALEAAYLAGAAAGFPSSMVINGRTVTRDWKMIMDRIDRLRAQTVRETSGNFYAGQFRRPE